MTESCACPHCSPTAMVLPSPSEVIKYAREGSLLRGCARHAAVHARRSLHQLSRTLDHDSTRSRALTSHISSICALLVEPAVDSCVQTVEQFTPAVVGTVLSHVDGFVSLRAVQFYQQVRQWVQCTEKFEGRDVLDRSRDSKLALEVYKKIEKLKIGRLGIGNCDLRDYLHHELKNGTELFEDVTKEFNLMLDSFLALIEELLQSQRTLRYVEKEDTVASSRVPNALLDISKRKQKIEECLCVLLGVLNYSAGHSRECELKLTIHQSESRRTLGNVQKSLQNVLSMLSQLPSLSEGENDLVCVTVADSNSLEQSHSEILNSIDQSLVALSSKISELLNDNTRHLQQISQLEKLQKRAESLKGVEDRAENLKRENQALRDKLTQVNLFIVSDSGKRISNLENELAQTKLLLAQSEAEKDELEVRLDEILNSSILNVN